VEGEALRQLEPGLVAPAAGGLWLPRVAQLRNPRMVRALRLDLAARGVELREGVEVTGFQDRGGRLAGVDTGAGQVEADCCVVAAGAWSGGLLAATGLILPLRPVKGQMLLLRADPGVLRRILIYRRHYLIPRRDGRVLVGSSMEETGFEKSATAAVRHELRQAATALLPALGAAPLEAHWAGLRPGSPDGVPFMDRHPHIGGLYVCSGHFRNGLAMAPASARLMADLVLERPTLLDPAPFRINSLSQQGVVA
jgi:glycine oxidase